MGLVIIMLVLMPHHSFLFVRVAFSVWATSSLGGGGGGAGRAGVGVPGESMACVIHDIARLRPFSFPP